LHKSMHQHTAETLTNIQKVAVTQGNIFEELIEAVKVASLGQITEAMFDVGGAYRRNM